MMGHDLSADLLGQPPLGAKSEMKTAIKGSDANEKGDKMQCKFIRIALCQVSLSVFNNFIFSFSCQRAFFLTGWHILL